MGNDKYKKELVSSPRQAFREAVCMECKEHTTNKGGCGAGTGDILACIRIIEFDDELLPRPENTGTAGADCPCTYKCEEDA